MFCLGCGYDLRATADKCPECGRGFDPTRKGTFAASLGRLRVRKMARFVARWSLRFFILALVVLTVLRFGNPRWTRWIYIFQAYVWPAPPDRLVLPPDDFTGSWEVWHPDGSLALELPVKDGKLHGQMDGLIPARMIWSAEEEAEINDQPVAHWYRGRGRIVEGRCEGLWVTWGLKYGEPSKGFYRNGKRDGPWIHGATINGGTRVWYFKNGVWAQKSKSIEEAGDVGFTLDAADWKKPVYELPTRR